MVEPGEGGGEPSTGAGSVRQDLKKRLRGRIEAMILPDRAAGWIPFATYRALRLVKSKQIDVLLTTAPAASAHTVGLIVSAVTGVPWVAEFRDPWTQYAFAVKRFFPFDRLEQALEGLVLRRADRVVCTTSAMCRSFASLHPSIAESKLSVISGFYDEHSLQKAKPVVSNRFTIIFTGHLYDSMKPVTLFEGLSSALAARPAMRGRVRCLFVGRQYIGLDQLTARWGLEDVVERVGYLPNEDVLGLLFGAHVAYYRVTSDLVVNAKLFEYLRSGVHILGVLQPEHPAAAIIREAGAGSVVPPGEASMVADVLVRLFDSFAAGRHEATDVSRPEVTRFDGSKQSAELVALLDSLT